MKGTDRPKGKGLIRSLNRKGTRFDKSPAVAVKMRGQPALKDPSVCERCGAVYKDQKWRRIKRLSDELLGKAAWVECPACVQEKKSGLCYGKVLVSGAYARDNIDAIRRRIGNVERRAGFTQPQRRVVSSEWDGRSLEVLTTSQKLAHRIAHELEKAFGGRAKYRWSSEDGSLYATWKHEAR